MRPTILSSPLIILLSASPSALAQSSTFTNDDARLPECDDDGNVPATSSAVRGVHVPRMFFAPVVVWKGVTEIVGVIGLTGRSGMIKAIRAGSGNVGVVEELVIV
jgi:hypothetical protein